MNNSLQSRVSEILATGNVVNEILALDLCLFIERLRRDDLQRYHEDTMELFKPKSDA